MSTTSLLLCIMSPKGNEYSHWAGWANGPWARFNRKAIVSYNCEIGRYSNDIIGNNFLDHLLNLSLCSMCFRLDVFERVVDLRSLGWGPASLLSEQLCNNYIGKMQHSFKNWSYSVNSYYFWFFANFVKKITTKLVWVL